MLLLQKTHTTQQLILLHSLHSSRALIIFFSEAPYIFWSAAKKMLLRGLTDLRGTYENSEGGKKG